MKLKNFFLMLRAAQQGLLETFLEKKELQNLSHVAGVDFGGNISATDYKSALRAAEEFKKTARAFGVGDTVAIQKNVLINFLTIAGNAFIFRRLSDEGIFTTKPKGKLYDNLTATVSYQVHWVMLLVWISFTVLLLFYFPIPGDRFPYIKVCFFIGTILFCGVFVLIAERTNIQARRFQRRKSTFAEVTDFLGDSNTLPSAREYQSVNARLLTSFCSSDAAKEWYTKTFGKLVALSGREESLTEGRIGWLCYIAGIDEIQDDFFLSHVKRDGAYDLIVCAKSDYMVPFIETDTAFIFNFADVKDCDSMYAEKWISRLPEIRTEYGENLFLESWSFTQLLKDK